MPKETLPPSYHVNGDKARTFPSVKKDREGEFSVWITSAECHGTQESSDQSTKAKLNFKHTQEDPIWETLQTFCNTTTGHGFGRLIRPNEPIKYRWLWGTLLLFLVTILVVSICNITSTTFGNRNVYHDQVLKINDSMIFPDIQLCASSLYNHSRLRAMGINDTMATYLALTLSATLISENIRTDAYRQRQLNQELETLTARHGSLTEILKRVTLQCQEIIAGCVRFTVSLNSSECCKSYFGDKVHLSEFGACVTTQGDPHMEEILPSLSTGFIVYFKTNIDPIEFDPSIIAPSMGMKTGVVFAIEDSYTHSYSALSYKGLNVAPGYWATIPISLHIVDNQDLRGALLAPYSCIDRYHATALDLVPGFNTYSKLNCKMAAVQRFIEKEFNCSMISIPTNNTFKACYPSQIIDFFCPDKLQLIRNHERHNCIIDCEEYNYIAKISTAKITLAEQHYRQGWNESSLIALHFYFPSFTYTFTKNHPESILKWLADVGGNMGLYMGASFVTIVEILIFVFHCLTRASVSLSNKRAGNNHAIRDTSN